MTEREKMIEIVLDTEITGIKLRNITGGMSTANAIADALIAANIGDVTEWKEKVECAKRILQIPTLPDGKTDLSYFEYKGERVQDIVRLRDEYRHRAEVAERALLLMASGECTFASPEFYKEEAEQEVAEEEQIMANRCGEGKCEYFESIRSAANNNRENGYCKKYKQALHLYDWWWLKCDECTAEKELAEEEKK